MSLDASRWAWQQQVTPAQKLVLLSLADRADENHYCYPSTERLIQDTGLYKSTIFDSIKIMEAMGLIEVIRKQGVSNKYRLIGVKGRDHQSGKPDQSQKSHQYEKSYQTSLENHTTQCEKPDYHQSGKPDTNLPIEPINNQSKNLPKTRGRKISLSEYTENCKAEGRKLIPEDDAVFDFIERAGIPDEFLRIAWLAFRDEFIHKPDKKQASWPQTFRNYVKNDYVKVWYLSDGKYQLTTKGQQWQKYMQENVK